MALNIKSEQSEGTSSIVDLSSDTEIPEMKQPERPARTGTPDTHCSICLEELNNKCHPDTCWHKFCFECLKRWSLIERSCPLCKTSFRQIFHSFIDENSTAVYDVPSTQTDEFPRLVIRPFNQLSEESRTFRMNLFLDIVRRTDSRGDPSAALIYERNVVYPRDYNFNIGVHTIPDTERSESPVGNLVSVADHLVNFNAQIMRRRVYEDNMWAQPLPDLSGRFRDCSLRFYRDNPAQTYRLHGFILRDITVLRNITMFDVRVIHRAGVNEEILTNLIMRTILTHDIRDIYMINMLRPFIADFVDHFIHELFNYANSPYDLIGYDRNVRYIDGRLHRHTLVAYRDHPDIPGVDIVELNPVTFPINTNLIFVNEPVEPIVVDTDDEDPIIIIPNLNIPNPSEVIEINSSSGESDVEIINIIETEPPDTSSRDQPSTSTGIQDSLNRPNTRYNLRRRRLLQSNLNHQQPNCSRLRVSNDSQIERIVLDSSSDDEIIETNTRGTQTMPMKPEVNIGRRKRKVKKSKQKRRKKIVVDSRSGVRVSSRTRPRSESSSTDDADINTGNNFMNTNGFYS